MRKKIKLTLVFTPLQLLAAISLLLICALPLDIDSESMTLTTYYPAPYGMYSKLSSAQLDVTGTLKLADGTQGPDKILISDTNGAASWQSTIKPSRLYLNGIEIPAPPAGTTAIWKSTTVVSGTDADTYSQTHTCSAYYTWGDTCNDVNSRYTCGPTENRTCVDLWDQCPYPSGGFGNRSRVDVTCRASTSQTVYQLWAQ